MDHSGDSESTSLPPAKRRRLRACDSCRHRKIRCDNLPGSCRNCQVYRTECLISRDGVSVPRSNRPSKRMNINRCQSSGNVKQTTDGTSTDPVDGISSSYQHDISHHPSPTAMSARTPDTLQGVVTTELSPTPTNSKFAGMSSPQVLAKSVEGLFQSTAPHLDVMTFFCPMMSFAEELSVPMTVTRPLVDRDVADRCLSCYLSTYHTLLPIFSLQNLQRDYDNFYKTEQDTDASRAACILLVIALGSDDESVSRSHFQAANSLYLHLIARPYLYTVQALVLMTLCLINSGKDGQAFLTIGMATRIAQSIGLHRSIMTHHNPYEYRFVLKEHNLRNCIWWACYCLEKKLSFEGGRPSVINDEDCDADLPDPTDISTPGTNHETETRLPFLLHLIDIYKRLATISRTLFNIHISKMNEQDLLSRMENADTSLIEWRNALPATLRVDQELSDPQDEISELAASLLHCIYLNALLVIHRASLLGGQSSHIKAHPNRRIGTSDKICLNAARALARGVNSLVCDPRDLPVPRWVHPYAINSVMTIYIGLMRSPKIWSHDMDVALMRSLHHSFVQPEDPSSGDRFTHLIDSLCQAIETVKASSSTRSSLSSVSQPKNPQQLITPSYGPDESSIADNPEQQQCIPDVNGEGWVHPTPQSPFTQPFPAGVNGDEIPGAPWEQFQFADFFGDQPSSWNMQLWPVMPMEPSDGN